LRTFQLTRSIEVIAQGVSFVELLADKGRMGLSCPEDRLESTGLQEDIPKPLAVFSKVRREVEWSAGRGMYDDTAEEASSQWAKRKWTEPTQHPAKLWGDLRLGKFMFLQLGSLNKILWRESLFARKPFEREGKRRMHRESAI
jgi:hypothetical protein